MSSCGPSFSPVEQCAQTNQRNVRARRITASRNGKELKWEQQRNGGTRAPFSDCVRDMRAGGDVRGHDGRRAVCGVSEGGRIGFAGWAICGAGGGTGGVGVGVRRDVPFVVADGQGERAFAEALRLCWSSGGGVVRRFHFGHTVFEQENFEGSGFFCERFRKYSCDRSAKFDPACSGRAAGYAPGK